MGQMNIYQMLKHCTLYEEMLLGKKKFKQIFLGRLFGKIAMKELIGNESPSNEICLLFRKLRLKKTRAM